MTIFDKPSSKTVFVLIISWAFFAGLVMFSINFWISDITIAVGVLLGFLTIIWSEKIKTQNPFTRLIFAITSLFLIAGFSVGFLSLSCLSKIISPQFCDERQRTSLLMVDFFFVGAPIIATYLFVHVPRLIFQKKYQTGRGK